MPLAGQALLLPHRIQCRHPGVGHQIVEAVRRDAVVSVRYPAPIRLLVAPPQHNLCCHAGHRPTEPSRSCQQGLPCQRHRYHRRSRPRGDCVGPGDILHTSLEDGHRRLGYKILSGYIWTHLSCGEASHVVKTDDNVVMDLPALLRLAAHPLPRDSVTCGAGTPHRNHKTLRSDKPHMTGNWSTTKEELEDDIMPDFCCGFTYITSPEVTY